MAKKDSPTYDNPDKSAKRAGLIYVSDTQPGIVRRRAGKGFVYILPNGNTVKSKAVKNRIDQLAIPPAYEDVWICRNPHGHIQAVGKDERGRKQYIYHPQWHEVRDKVKFHRLGSFGNALPRIRQRTQYDLQKRGIPKEKVIAATIALLDKTLIRVGNERYAQENKSYGLTTMKSSHANVQGKTIRFRFRGKRDKKHEIDLEDPRLAKVIRKLQDLPGQNLFQYEDEVGARAAINSTDVNNYLRLTTGHDFTAKDFRTWHATLHAAITLHKLGACDSKEQATKHINDMLEVVAEKLGNTPAVCRTSYIHPVIIETYTKYGSLESFKKPTAHQLKKFKGVRKDEARLLKFLES